MNGRRLITIVAVTCLSGVCYGASLGSGDPVDKDYYVYVAAESDDTVHLVRFGPNGGEVVKTVTVGAFATETEGPHGIRVSPDGRYWYVSIAHGLPYGSVFKYDTVDNISVSDVQVGLFPATMDISSSTGLMFVANFNLHGDMEPSNVSVIDTVSMLEIAQIEQGMMPHGSRTSPDGKFHYSVGMMDDSLYEIDVMNLKVGRTLHLTKDDQQPEQMNQDGRKMAVNHDGHSMAVVKPTWAQPHPTKPFIYVALQGVDQVAEVSLEDWKITRRFHTQKGPYNLAISPDGKLLLATCKPDNSTAIWDLETGKELASVPASRRITHGVTISPDNRLAFVTVEGVADDPGTVDVIDLKSFETLASIDVGKQASGIDFWKIE
jgi:DNA-binding beta-propeller fold protein YncE